MASVWTFWTLLAAWGLLGCRCQASRTSGPSKGEQGASSVERVKRGWVWNQFFVVEEYTGTEPLYVGKIHTDSDEGEGNIKYTISGEGAGTIFIIDELTGDIHATERLDREEKAFYTLRAQARDRLSDDPLEPESEFVIKVQDINDSEPKFLEGPYIGSVAELSPIGTSVLKITASDADDPSYGSSARVVYSVPEEEKFFTVDRHTAEAKDAEPNPDRGPAVGGAVPHVGKTGRQYGYGSKPQMKNLCSGDTHMGRFPADRISGSPLQLHSPEGRLKFFSCHWNMVGVAKIVGEGTARTIPHTNTLFAQASASSEKSSGDRIKRRGQVKDVTGSS
ncbi:cadherin-22-like [Entelurus aequoreus]|uniref:cadherin-22-like n=1 Tax=Entelurus aequoreus TaxID=161455 RepID=UPI002B1D77B0|nr:cadherin-22-like [Entelurus aequoreus]